MGISKSMCSWIVKGVCATNGNIMTFWKTNFNMPVPNLFSGSSTYEAGFMAARYCSIGFTSEALTGFYPGYEIALADALLRWCVSDTSCLNGIGCACLIWYRGATCLVGNKFQICVNIPAPGSGYYTTSWYETMTNIGVAGWEVCTDATYCTYAVFSNVSGDDVSIGACSTDLYWGSVPSTSQTACQGKIWVEGNDLHYFNANQWEHVMVGDNQGSAGAGKQGSLWIDNSHYLHWVGADCNNYRAKWRICQFCSTFSNGAPANPSPGAGYKGSIWADSQFGWTHLSYIGCDGNKYLTGGGNYPYSAP